MTVQVYLDSTPDNLSECWRMCLSHVTPPRAAPAAAVRWRRQRCPRTTICHAILTASAYSCGVTPARSESTAPPDILVKPRRECTLSPLFPVELEPEGLSMIKGVRRRNTGRVPPPVLVRATAGVASICPSPTAQVQSAGLSQTLLLSYRHGLAGHMFLHRS